MTKVLFVCLGNICRSPAADGVMHKLVKDSGLEDKFIIDSAGTSAYHAGEPADGRMREHAEQRGYKLESLSRAFRASDFTDFDYILTMDISNYQDVMDLASDEDSKKKVFPFVKFCTDHDIDRVPDPYYGGMDGFDLVMDIVEDGCRGLLAHLKIQQLNQS